jgi:hypothetical protein
MPETTKPDLVTLVWDTEVVVDRLRALADLYAAAGLQTVGDRAQCHAWGWQKVADVIAGAMVLA